LSIGADDATVVVGTRLAPSSSDTQLAIVRLMRSKGMAMASETIEERMVMVETELQGLRALPKKVDDLAVQVSQLGQEMRSEFSAIRTEMKAFVTKEDAKAFLTKEDAKVFVTKEDAKVFATKDDLKALATKEELQGLGTQMRVLHEEVISRIALIQEGRGRRKG